MNGGFHGNDAALGVLLGGANGLLRDAAAFDDNAVAGRNGAQNGALLAKGRLLGIQFDTLFTDDLYWNISKHAIVMAEKLKQIFQKKGYAFYIDSPTNQQFVILENDQMERLQKEVAFSFWEKYDETHTVVRFATSWATEEADLQRLNQLL